MPGLFGFPSMIERTANRPAQGAGASFAQAGLAAGQAIRDSRARQPLQQTAIEQLMQMGTPESVQMANLISENPRAAQMMVEQQGGPEKFMQRLRSGATFAQGAQAMAQGATPNDILMQAAQMGGDPGTALALQQAMVQGERYGQRTGNEFVMQEMQDNLGLSGVGLYRVDKLTGQMERIGDAPPKRKGMEMVFDPETGRMVSISEGGYGASPGAVPLEKPNRKAAIESAMADLAAMDGLRLQLESVDPSQFNAGNRLWSGLSKIAENVFGVEPSPENREWRTKFFDTTAKSGEAVRAKVAATGGKNLTETEIAIALEGWPKVSQSILNSATGRENFDEYMSKAKVAGEFLALGAARNLFLLRHGLPPITEDSVPTFDGGPLTVDRMWTVIDGEADDIQQAAMGRGMQEPDARQFAKDEIRRLYPGIFN